MKNKKIIILGLVAAIVITVILLGSGIFRHGGKAARSTSNMNKEKKAEKGTGKRKILFYRNPMNPSITSQTPAKDSMGMDYIPVYEEGEAETGKKSEESKYVISKVKISKNQMDMAEVETELVKRRHLHKEIRTVGIVAYDPQLAVAQEEFISSLRVLQRGEEGRIPEIKERELRLVEASKRKLRLLGLNDEQIKELEDKKEIQSNLILPEKKMWVYGDVYEYELSWLKVGEKVKVTTSNLPGEEFYGVISSVNPVLDPKTRSVKFRAEIENTDLKLKPEMYVNITIMSMYESPEGEHMVLAVPREAVLDTGLRKIVWVDSGSGKFQGREVRVGPEATAEIDGKTERYLPILSGLAEGERVVTRGNFLIDSQSQLTGVAAAAYGGALESEKSQTPPSRHAN